MSRGRGRGRGRGRSLGNFELLGIAPGEAVPPPILQPPPDFPPLDRKPLELRQSEVDDYLLTVKQDVREYMKKSPFYLKAGSNKREIQRYSDRYQAVKDSEIDNVLGWEPDWSYFPVELQIGKKKTRRVASRGGTKFSPVVGASRKRKVKEDQDTESENEPSPSKKAKKVGFKEDSLGIDKKLSQLEKQEERAEAKGGGGGGGQTAGGEEDEAAAGLEDEEYYDEELEEEGTDYNLTYFDNGEDYIGGEDDNLEENEGPYY